MSQDGFRVHGDINTTTTSLKHGTGAAGAGAGAGAGVWAEAMAAIHDVAAMAGHHEQHTSRVSAGAKALGRRLAAAGAGAGAGALTDVGNAGTISLEDAATVRPISRKGESTSGQARGRSLITVDTSLSTVSGCGASKSSSSSSSSRDLRASELMPEHEHKLMGGSLPTSAGSRSRSSSPNRGGHANTGNHGRAAGYIMKAAGDVVVRPTAKSSATTALARSSAALLSDWTSTGLKVFSLSLSLSLCFSVLKVCFVDLLFVKIGGLFSCSFHSFSDCL